MSNADVINEVLQLKGESYTFMDMTIDDDVSRLTKNAQAREFAYVASVRLYVQKEMYKQQQARRNEQVEELNPIDTEFKDFAREDFINVTYDEEELTDIILDMKIQDVAVEEAKKERCVSWVRVRLFLSLITYFNIIYTT